MPSSNPKYMRIAQRIEDDIRAGKYGPQPPPENQKHGNQLPSKERMRQALGVSPGTLTRAYEVLERKRLIYTDQGSGTYVSRELPPPDAPSEAEQLIALAQGMDGQIAGIRAQLDQLNEENKALRRTNQQFVKEIEESTARARAAIAEAEAAIARADRAERDLQAARTTAAQFSELRAQVQAIASSGGGNADDVRHRLAIVEDRLDAFEERLTRVEVRIDDFYTDHSKQAPGDDGTDHGSRKPA